MSPAAQVALAAAVLVAVALVAAVGGALAAYAGRLDRLHRRVDGGAAALEAALDRRRRAAARLARSGWLDPAAGRRLAAAAEAAQGPFPLPLGPERERAESELSAVLRAVLAPAATAALADSADGARLLEEVADTGERVVLARRFVGDAVVQARRVRAKRLVRWARLAGRAPLPTTVELDDEPPPALAAHRAAYAHQP